MINVNFFEKKQVNVLPYILSGVFFIFLALMGIYFYLTQTYYVNLEQEQTTWMQNNAEDVALSRQIESLDRLANQSSEAQETLVASRFPTAFLTEDLAAALPAERDQVTSFQLNETSQVVLVLENTEVADASALIADLEARDYVDSVQLLRLENQQDDSEQFSFELTVELNEDALREVTEQ